MVSSTPSGYCCQSSSMHWTRSREELVRDVVTYWAEEYTYLKRIHYTNMSAIKVTDWGTYTHGGMDMGAWSFRPASQPSSSLTSLYGDEEVMMMMTTTKSIIVIRTGHQVYINWMVSPAQSSTVHIHVTTKASQPAHKAGGGKGACQSHKTRLKFSK